MWRYILAAAITAVIMMAIYGPRPGRASPSTFEWSGTAAPASWVNVRNNNGNIRVEPADHDSVEVTARISGGRGARDMRVVVKEHDGNLYVCPTVSDRGRCGPGGYSVGRARGLARLFRRGSTGRVDLTVRIPDGLNADASTSNGTLFMGGVVGEANARTVNGRIQLEDIFGSVTARSTNGSIRVRLDTLPAQAALSFRTTNGSVTAELPASLSADVDLSTTNGRINSHFPVVSGGEISSRRFRGRIGEGGRELSMRTTNGSITLRPVGGGDEEGTAAHGADFESHIEHIVEEAMKKVEVVFDTLHARKGAAPRPPAPAVRVRVSPPEAPATP